MHKTEIEARIQAAIAPVLDRADELLDHYTEGLPYEAWLPIAVDLREAIADVDFAMPELRS